MGRLKKKVETIIEKTEDLIEEETIDEPTEDIIEQEPIEEEATEEIIEEEATEEIIEEETIEEETIETINRKTVQFCKAKRSPKQKFDHIHIWVKSSFDTETKNGSWCFISIDDHKDIITMTGQETNIDKNKIQLIPLLECLEWFNDGDSNDAKKKQLTIFTTSTYLVGVVQEWIDKWKKNNFMINDINERPNASLLRKIEILKQTISVSVKFLIKENDFSQKAEELSYNSL